MQAKIARKKKLNKRMSSTSVQLQAYPSEALELTTVVEAHNCSPTCPDYQFQFAFPVPVTFLKFFPKSKLAAIVEKNRVAKTFDLFYSLQCGESQQKSSSLHSRNNCCCPIGAFHGIQENHKVCLSPQIGCIKSFSLMNTV